MMSEEIRATWDKRFKARHYSYRDFHTVGTTVTAELLALAQAIASLAAGAVSTAFLYVFGTNARATINPYTLALPIPQAYGVTAWPTYCYAREVKVMCTEDAWVKIVSLNPEYLKQATLQSMTNVVPTAPQLIFEREQFLPANEEITFYPTYGYALVFRGNTAGGTLYLWVEGNTEGGE
jgi:hypothetical protein